MEKRQTLTVPLDGESLKIVADDCNESGMARAELMRRLLGWYAAQDEAVRGAIRRTIPRSMFPETSKVRFDPEPVYQNLVVSKGRPKGRK